ncbi:membrane protein insertase YidC [Gymnodinialimonas sp. 2305UL16-5]|uniref:membrane protein insertase YidC n=1 Tax=Gymnodinialimonas mytili TaxID=3126503 RepID=UPI0030B7366E
MDDQNRNLILATGLSFVVILVWFILFPPPEIEDPNALPPETAETGTAPVTDTDIALTPPITAEGTPAAAETEAQTEVGLAEAARVPIESDVVEGSISLLGGRIDDLSLRNYTTEIDSDEIVRLLSPVGTDDPYYALYGWTPSGSISYDEVPTSNTPWEIETGDTLTPDSPVTLVWDNDNGLIFRRTIELDENYMFQVTQSVENTGEGDVNLAPYGIVARHGLPSDLQNFFILHEGVVRKVDGDLSEISYDNITELDVVTREGVPAEVVDVEANGWIGFTDKYWMTTLIPGNDQPFVSVTKYVPNADIYQTEARLPYMVVAAGETVEVTTNLFAGAKEAEVIRDYENREPGWLGAVFGAEHDPEALQVERFIDSIDWGWFYFLTKPIFWMLHWLNAAIGNMGWAIIGLTFIIKAILFPLAYKSYVSMAKMKELQPEMEKLKESAGDDREKMQRGMMELYKKNKVNPAGGCLPILLQIPIFFSLYKVIFVTLELRHAPFFGWLNDLSAPDSSSIINLFGLLPNAAPDPESIMALIFIGILPIILGISMWLQQKLNPAPTDPTQAAIFAWLPWVFMFMLGGFASGLLVYWIANNTLTFTQQYLIMRSQGFKPDVFGNIRKSFQRKPKDSA